LRPMIQTPFQDKPRIRSLLTALLLLAILLPVWWWASLRYEDYLLSQERDRIFRDITVRGQALGTALQHRVTLLRGLKSFVDERIAIQEAIQPADFTTLAAALQLGAPGIRSLSVTPEGMPPMVYPATETAPGGDPARDRRQQFRNDLQRAGRLRKPVISSPRLLPPKTMGLTILQVSFRGDLVWGVISMVLELPPVLTEAGLEPVPDDLEVVLRDRSDRVLLGNKTTLEGSPVLKKIELPDGTWKLAAIPRQGWKAAIVRSLLQFQTVTAALVLLLTALISLMAGQGARLRLSVRQRTAELQRALDNHRDQEEHLNRTIENLRRTMRATLEAQAHAVETKDPHSSGHQRRVADLARTIATEMGLPQTMIEGIRMAAVIHDIGKIAIPAEVLGKPDRLSEEEFNLIRNHPQAGYDILKEVDFPWPVGRMVWQHHERLDGSGYPLGISGDEILMEARVLAVADVVEAMASDRAYRPMPGLEKGLEEIQARRGILYDPAVVDACIRIFREKDFRLE